ncbi:PAS domain S-box protein [Algibacter miyuki]|uniref:histidine kinase n=1 Tax=Algibacter miyuki TaxID=1306933 RepID=A0ABV5H0D0_9FLAO|nr:PAS domain-containing sensor histidine kinase [Algibacter miyuki]MDN3667408.1 PAS domain S-box protein [Algibacter miyuki]
MDQDQIDILKRALARERAARKEAEKILESKAAELYQAKQQLEKSYSELELLLDKKNSQLQGVFENIVDAYLIMDLSGSILKMNDAAVSLLGFENDKVDVNLMSMVNPKDYEYVSNSFQELFQKGTLTDFEIKIKTNLNLEKLLHINASIIYDNGKAVAAQGIIRDITKDKEAEERLVESENRLSTLILNLDSGVVLENENREIVLTNKKFTELFNIDIAPDALKGVDCKAASKQNSVLFKNPEHFITRMHDIDKKKEVVLGDELEMVNGRILERNYIPIIQGNKSKGYLWTFKDITEQRNYRKSLEAEKEKYSSIISNMNLGLVEVDTNDKILMINQSFMNMTGYTKQELIGFKGADILPHQEDKSIIEQQINERKLGKTESYELRIKNKQGQTRHWLVSGAPNYNLKGEIIGSIGINFDITEIKNLQLQKESLLKKLEKSNDELHEYAHVVSHDLKSPLRSINALVSWLKSDNKDNLDAASLQNLALIDDTLEKMEQLITDVLHYSSIGSESTEKADIDLSLLVNDLLKTLYIPEHININIPNTLPVVIGNKTKLQQLFQNLISNSIKFIDKEVGNIEIGIKDLDTHYQFFIKDNGIGIDKKFHDKIFKIFHVLNKSKDSTGIGLSIVKKIIELHEGEIWLESEPKVGTVFHFTLKK